PLYAETADCFAYRQCFNDCESPQITAAFAAIAAASAVKDSFALFDPEARENFRLRLKFLTAIGANPSHQTLRTRHQDRAGNQEWLDPHVVQTRDRAGGIVGVQSGKHLVTGQCRFHRTVGSLVVTYLAPHYDYVL